jgi:hypothetical protein
MTKKKKGSTYGPQSGGFFAHEGVVPDYAAMILNDLKQIRNPKNYAMGGNYGCEVDLNNYNPATSNMNFQQYMKYGGYPKYEGGGVNPWGQGAFANEQPAPALPQSQPNPDPNAQERTEKYSEYRQQNPGEMSQPLSSEYASKPGEEGQMQDASGFNDPNEHQDYNAQPQTQQSKPQKGWNPWTHGNGNMWAAAVATGNMFNSMRQQRYNEGAQREAGMSDNAFARVNAPGAKGDYVPTGTALGAFRPDQMTPGFYGEMGGMFKGGGKTKQPIYVDSPNDPRYRAYQDSLSAYTIGMLPATKENLEKYVEAAKKVGAGYITPSLQPKQKVIVGQPLQKLPIGTQPTITPQQMSPVPVPALPPIQQKGWYSNSQNIPMWASDEEVSNKLYNPDGSRKYELGGEFEATPDEIKRLRALGYTIEEL